MSILSSFNYKLKRKIKAIGVMLRAFGSFEEFLGAFGIMFFSPIGISWTVAWGGHMCHSGLSFRLGKVTLRAMLETLKCWTQWV